MRKRLAAVFACVALLAGLAWWLFGKTPPEEPPAGEPPAPPVPVAAPTPSEPIPPREELPEPVQRYLESTVYPPDSGRLDTAGDLALPNARYERFKRVPGSQGSQPDIEFRWTADAFRYTSDETVHTRFEARQGEVAAVVHDLEGWAQAEGRSGLVGEPRSLRFSRDGDAWAADLDLSSSFEEHHGFVVLGVRYTVADVTQQEERIRVFVTPESAIPGRFTGTFRDATREGSLVVEAGVELYRDGFYRFDANLFDARGRPLAFATFKGERTRRDGVVPLRFFGKVLHDLSAAGPYEVRQLRGYLFLDGEFPDRIHLRDFAGSYRTREFSLSDFSEAEWDDEHRRHMVELMLQDEAAGIPVDVPSLAVGTGDEVPPDGAQTPPPAEAP